MWKEFESAGNSSLPLEVSFCSLGPSFIPKGKIGDYFQAISRNGLVLLVSPELAREISGLSARLRISVWRRIILPGDSPTPYGLILSTRTLKTEAKRAEKRVLMSTSLDASHSAGAALSIELGGQRILNFFR